MPSGPATRHATGAPTVLRLSKAREVAFGVAVAVGFIAAMEPSGIGGTYSQFEVALIVLAVASCASIGAPLSKTPPIPLPLVGLLGIMGLSAVWSSASWETLRDVATYAVFALAAWLIVRQARLSTIVTAIVVAGGLILGASLVVMVIDPDAAFYYEASGLQGIYSNRNAFGVVMLQVIPAALALNAKTGIARVGKFVVVASFFAAAALSLSKTTMAVSALALLVWAALVLARRSAWFPAVIGGGLLAIALIAAINFAKVLDFLGKDPTINGRLEIWSAVLRVFPESPLVGFGWSRSWPPGSPHSAAVAEALGGQIVFHAHNEVLNWLITTGVIGVVLVVMLYGFACWAGLRAYWANVTTAVIWLPLAAVTLIARGLSEISETNAQGWFTLMLVLFACARYLPDSALSNRSGAFFMRLGSSSRTQHVT